jgi:hypothetical protein
MDLSQNKLGVNKGDDILLVCCEWLVAQDIWLTSRKTLGGISRSEANVKLVVLKMV